MDSEYGILLEKVVNTDVASSLPHFYLVVRGHFKNGYKNGFWKTTYAGKQVKTENYDCGRLIGYYRVYNTEGELLYKMDFGSKGNGLYKDYYYKTGILKAKGHYKNGKKQGKWYYYDEAGNLKKKMMYEDGDPLSVQKLDTKIVRTFSFLTETERIKGKLKFSYKYSSLDGEYVIRETKSATDPGFVKSFYIIGIKHKGTFNKGFKTGQWVTTYKNKRVKIQNYENGLVVGRYRVYNTQGELLYETDFDPQGNGLYKDYYYKTGILKVKGHYKNGKKEGKWYYYDEAGNLKKTVIYEEGCAGGIEQCRTKELIIY